MADEAESGSVYGPAPTVDHSLALATLPDDVDKLKHDPGAVSAMISGVNQEIANAVAEAEKLNMHPPEIKPITDDPHGPGANIPDILQKVQTASVAVKKLEAREIQREIAEGTGDLMALEVLTGALGKQKHGVHEGELAQKGVRGGQSLTLAALFTTVGHGLPESARDPNIGKNISELSTA